MGEMARCSSRHQAEAHALARCRSEPHDCTPAAKRFIGIIKQAEALRGRAKLELVNLSVNAAIHYMTDMAQWGVENQWLAPLDVNNNGSFDTGFGDCKDYAIAKYVALRQAGMPDSDLRVVVVRDNSVRMDHAVLAARLTGHWLVLDSRCSRLSEDKEIKQFTPLFALNEHGVKLLAAPYAAKKPTDINL
jgi:predicted transglutaminase-like cysteine proteinase